MSDKIKIKDIEGNVQQISDLCQNSGFDLNQYLNQKPAKRSISKTWLSILIPAFFAISCLVWIGVLNPALTKICVLALFLSLGVIVYIIYHNHENWVTALIAVITGLCLILICLNVYTPKELAKRLEERAVQTIDQK